MGGGDLNMKKSWHPLLHVNQERVWKQEKKAYEERKKLDELRRERDQEREMQELQRLQEEAGGKKRVDKVDWMYAAPSTANGPSASELEDYLLGKKGVDQYLNQKAKEASQKNLAVGKGGASKDSFMALQNANTSGDLAAKIREDPMLAIKQQEQAAYQALLKDPTRLRQLRAAAGLADEDSKEERRQRKKEKKRRRAEEDERSRDHSRRRGYGESCRRYRDHYLSRRPDRGKIVGDPRRDDRGSYGDDERDASRRSDFNRRQHSPSSAHYGRARHQRIYVGRHHRSEREGDSRSRERDGRRPVDLQRHHEKSYSPERRSHDFGPRDDQDTCRWRRSPTPLPSSRSRLYSPHRRGSPDFVRPFRESRPSDTFNCSQHHVSPPLATASDNWAAPSDSAQEQQTVRSAALARMQSNAAALNSYRTEYLDRVRREEEQELRNVEAVRARREAQAGSHGSFQSNEPSVVTAGFLSQQRSRGLVEENLEQRLKRTARGGLQKFDGGD